jgi:hypothetical protein
VPASRCRMLVSHVDDVLRIIRKAAGTRIGGPEWT